MSDDEPSWMEAIRTMQRDIERNKELYEALAEGKSDESDCEC